MTIMEQELIGKTSMRAAKSLQSRVDRNRQESTGIELQRVALRTRFARLWEVADWSFAPHRHTRLLSIPVDSCRFGLRGARRGPDATSRRVYERGACGAGGVRDATSRPWSRVDRNRQESTGIELQRVALRTRFARLWEVADWSFAPHRHTRLLSIPVDSCRFGLRGARRGPDATSRRVYERGRMYEGLGAGSLSRRWDYASERSAA